MTDAFQIDCTKDWLAPLWLFTEAIKPKVIGYTCAPCHADLRKKWGLE